jgi:hypothetical protein
MCRVFSAAPLSRHGVCFTWRACLKDNPPGSFHKEKTMSLGTLEDLFLQEIKDIYDAEKQILKALPKMAKAVESEQLRAAIEEHHVVTEKQVERLEEIFQMLGKPARGKKCAAMEGLLKEGSDILKEDAEPAVLDRPLSLRRRKSSITRLPRTALSRHSLRFSAMKTPKNYSAKHWKKKRKPTKR